MRLLAGYIFFLLLALPAAAQNASWWYPLGPPEATRRISAPTDSQDASALVIKWRTPWLRNSPVLLVGAIHPAGDRQGAGAQQVVGMAEGSDTLMILSSGGRRLLVRPADRQQLGEGLSFRLTGLFNTAAPSPDPFQRPNVIGLGVERTQETLGEALFGLLVDSSGSVVRYLKIAALDNDLGDDSNGRAGIFPVAAFTPAGSSGPVAIAIVSQDEYDDPDAGDTMVNSLRRYRLGAGIDATQEWSTPFAPRGYEQHPGILRREDTVLVAPANSTYPIVPFKTVRPPTSGNQVDTRSDFIYSFNVRVDGTAPEVIDSRRIPPVAIEGGTVLGRGDSYFMLQYADTTDKIGTWRKISTENHSPANPGRARIFVTSATQRITDFRAFYESDRRDIGWTIAVADADGSDNVSPQPTTLFQNKGEELVAAFSLPGNQDIEQNRLHLFRWNDPPTIEGGSRLTMFASSAFSGRLMATGDLVSDPYARQEIVIANDRTLRILQLRPYNDRLFGGTSNESLRRPFDTLVTLDFDSKIVSVVLADLEGDGANDIVVSTLGMTYAVGRAPAQPFGVISVTDTVCQGMPATLKWSRRAGDGSAGTVVTITGASESRQIVQPFGSPDSLDIPTESLPPGRYRVAVQDPSLPALVDSSRSFFVRSRSIDSFLLPDGDLAVGSTVSFRSAVSCVDGVVLEYSFDMQSWSRTGEEFELEQRGSVISVAGTILCPPQIACGAAARLKIYYRLAGAAGEIISATDSLTVAVAPRMVSISPGDTSRSRRHEITWNPDDFSCSSLRITLQADGLPPWSIVEPTSRGKYVLDLPIEFSDTVELQICCATPEASCEFATGRLLAERLEQASYIAPNPFDPVQHTEGARLLYQLTSPGAVSVVIYDASRAIVRRLDGGREQEAGFHGDLFWDGRNERGEIVANGTYICVIESSSGERILLQMMVVKH